MFGAAPKNEVKCLNDATLPGSKLLHEIVDVLPHFRRAPAASSADSAEMFLQVRLREEDQAFHREHQTCTNFFACLLAIHHRHFVLNMPCKVTVDHVPQSYQRTLRQSRIQ